MVGPTRVDVPNGILIDSAVFVGIAIVTDRPTDRPHYSVGNNRLKCCIHTYGTGCGLIVVVTITIIFIVTAYTSAVVRS